MKELCHRRFNRQWACSDHQRGRLDARTELDDAFGPALRVGPRPSPGHCILSGNYGTSCWVTAEEERWRSRDQRRLQQMTQFIRPLTEADITGLVYAGHLEAETEAVYQACM